MSFPKFTAEASIGNYENYSYVGRKYDNDNSKRIEPAIPPGDYNCYATNCRTQSCKYICGLGPPIERCDGTREICEYECYRWDEDGYLDGPYPGGTSRTSCNGF